MTASQLAAAREAAAAQVAAYLGGQAAARIISTPTPEGAPSVTIS